MKDSAYTLSYAAAMGIVCALLLTGIGRFTEPYRQANARAEEVHHILDVLGVPIPAKASAKELLDVYKKNVEQQGVDGLELFVYAPNGHKQAVAVPFAGPGLWGPIKGFLSLEPDMRTIRGVTFSEQEETPGLGGEIASEAFRDQFKGKKIASGNGKVGIHILRGGGATGPSEVDGITGATLTGEKVQAMLNATIGRIVEENGQHGK